MHKTCSSRTAGNEIRRLFTRPSPLSCLRRAHQMLLLVFAVCVAAGCATTQETRQSLAAYVKAMDEVEQSANMFLTDFADELRVQKELARVGGAESVTSRPPYPATFVPPPDPNVPQTEFDKALMRNRQALLVIRQYNNALVALAEGHSEQEVRARTSELGAGMQTLATIVGASIPGLSLLVDIAPKVIKLAQDAHNREQLAKAVAEGRPAVIAILKHLESETPRMYRLSVVATSQAESKLQENIQRTADALKGFIPRHGPPTDAAMVGRMATFQGELGEIERNTRMQGVMPIPLPYTNGRPAFDAAAAAEGDIFMQSLRASAQKYVELIAKQNAYHDLLTKYVLAIRQTQNSLNQVADSLTKPVDLRAEAAQLLKVSFELRDAISAYRNPSAASAAP
jgi:hypothetical protein